MNEFWVNPAPPDTTEDLLWDLDETVARLAREAGLSHAGIAPVPPPDANGENDLSYLADWIEKGHAGEMEYLKRRDGEDRLLRSSLRIPFPWARSVVVCAANYQVEAAKSTDPAPEGSGWIARYAWTGYQAPEDQESPAASGTARSMSPSDYHTVLLGRLKKLERLLQEQVDERLGEGRDPFESRCFVDTGPVVERFYARLAGVGWTGKNTCTLNQRMGSWFFLGVIVTSLQLPASRAVALQPAYCGSCTRCLDACPTGALIAPYQMDASLCISYLTIEKRGAIPQELRPLVGRQVFGCDICQDVCPWNRKAPISADPELAVRPELVNPALEWLAELDGESFRRLFRPSALNRAKLGGLLRNVAIAMGNSGLERYRPKLRQWAQGSDLVLAEAAEWAIRRLDETTVPPNAPQTEPADGTGACDW